ncbi:MAG: CPBP family intramembrane glutamic endopeptidase [Parvularculaceae bacterium]
MRTENPDDDPRAFLFAMAGLIAVFAAAFGLGLLLEAPPAARFSFDVGDLLIGVAATAPMFALFYWSVLTRWRPVVAFRESQIGFFAGIGFSFTPLRIAIFSIGAGIGEELLFRGVLQTWMAGLMPVWLAIILSNLIFGALHARTVLYAIIAGLVGVYLGALLEISGNLLAPIIAHALYDAIALDYFRRAIARKRSRLQHRAINQGRPKL